MADGPQQRGVLYGGHDIVNAAQKSTLVHSLKERFKRSVNGLGVFTDAIVHRKNNEGQALEISMASGTLHGTSLPASVAYLGYGDNKNWCLSTTLSHYKETSTQHFPTVAEAMAEFRNRSAQTDIAYTDGIDSSYIERASVNYVQFPAWVKQRTRVLSDWPLQIQSLKRGTRQQISRILRKYPYHCQLSNSTKDASDFYEQQYQPHIRAHYGKSAVVVDKEHFCRECRRGVLLQLIDDNQPVATALLRPVGQTMSIVWSGMTPGIDAAHAPGATDVLDYFSLLYAHLTQCKWLDFGPSRANIYDGVFRYKRKWGSEIYAGHFAQTVLHMTCNERSDAAREFLQRHAFISRSARSFSATVFTAKCDSTESVQEQITRLLSPGISCYRIVTLTPLQESVRADLKRLHPRISIYEAESVSDALRYAAQETSRK